MRCLLCKSESLEKLCRVEDKREYYKCHVCDLIFLDPRLRLNLEDEKERYLKHENDIHDLGYKNFVKPLVEAVKKHLPQGRGLDFGSGSGPVLSHMLREEGYEVRQYDPFFAPYPEALSNEYDFIVSSEVVEHLYDPLYEFERLRGLLKPGGMLAVMTLLHTDEDIFDWYYSRDPTHVVFYSQKNIEWLSQHLRFTSYYIEAPRIIVFIV